MISLKAFLIVVLVAMIVLNLVVEVAYHKISNIKLLKFLDNLGLYTVGISAVLILIVSAIG